MKYWEIEIYSYEELENWMYKIVSYNWTIYIVYEEEITF